MDQEARHVHLVADGDLRAIGGFGLDQLRQPRRGVGHQGLTLLEVFGRSSRHAVQPQAFQVGDEIK